MPRLQLVSAAEQVAAHLRSELLSGRLRGLMPGVLRLEAELGVNRKIIETALGQLERDGILQARGAGKRRTIVDQAVPAAHSLRVAILLGEMADRRVDYIIELHHELLEAGHVTFYPSGTLSDLGMDPKRVARLVERTQADAWIVVAGSKDVLQWFATQRVHAMALFGRREGVPIASVGPDKRPSYAAAARALMSLGHRRIVMLARSRRRLPVPGTVEQAFLDELARGGLSISEYNLPDWEESKGGLQELLGSLFRVTPPTALLIDEAAMFSAAQMFLSAHGLRVPQHVSLICTDPVPTFAWCMPGIAHINWDSAPVVRRIVRWVRNISLGQEDRRQTLTPAEFIPDGTIGPAP